jgi:hypothetical protein
MWNRVKSNKEFIFAKSIINLQVIHEIIQNFTATIFRKLPFLSIICDSPTSPTLIRQAVLKSSAAMYFEIL